MASKVKVAYDSSDSDAMSDDSNQSELNTH